MMKNLNKFATQYLAEYIDRLILLGFGFGIGVKVIVINHDINPGLLDLTLAPADYVLIITAPIAVVLLSVLIAKILPGDNDDDAIIQDQLNEILESIG